MTARDTLPAGRKQPEIANLHVGIHHCMPAIETPPVLRVNVCQWSGGSVSLASDEVRIWVVPLDTPPIPPEELLPHLTLEEQARADRYRVARARLQFVLGRGLLRRILGTYLDVAPRDVRISYTGAGKPILEDVTSAVHFNVTHTDGLALVALAAHPVGVDVERVRYVEHLEGLVGRFFSAPERIQYLALTDAHRSAAFFRGWTCKEALIKAAGLSVAYLDEFDVELHPERPARLLAARRPGLVGHEWSLATWEPTPGHAAAIAVMGGWRLVVEGVP